MFRKTLLILSGFATVGLAACGEGYEVVPFRGSVPYTEERTAGAGVAYVRAMMLPEKGPVLEMSEPTLVEPVQDASPLFTTPQLKK